MTVDERSAITREIRVAARPETVFAFLTDPAKMVRWMGGRVELDPRSGGVYRVEINTRDIARGEYVEVVPHRRVVFTWGWEGRRSRAGRINYRRDHARSRRRQTIVRLVHRDLPEEARDVHARGWEHYLGRLAVAAAGGDPGPDPNVTGGKM